MSEGFSDAGIRYADGVIQLNMTDLTSAGFGTPWGQTRNWTNGPGYINGSLLGNNVIASQMPTLQQANNGGTLILLTSGTNVRFFDFSGGAYTERLFLQDKLVQNTTTHDFTLVDNSGKVLKLYDFSTSNPTLQQGTFESLTDQYGNVTSVTSHTADGKIAEVQSSYTVGSTTITDSYLFTYLASGVNQKLSAKRHPAPQGQRRRLDNDTSSGLRVLRWGAIFRQST
ncbi:MAG: hypothetical protein ACJ8FY_28465 [Gemmataceae bacterium]